MILFSGKIYEQGAATVYLRRFQKYKYAILFKDCSVIASVRTYDEALLHIKEVDEYRQDLIIKKLKEG